MGERGIPERVSEHFRTVSASIIPGRMSDEKSGEPVQMYERRYSKIQRPAPLIMCLFDIEKMGKIK